MYVDDTIRQCVLFLGNKDGKTGRFIPRATAFVVSIMDDEDIGFRYVVTAEHNVAFFRQKGWDIHVRSNLRDGGVREDSWANGHWYFHPEPGSTDVAVAPIDFRPEEEFKQILMRSYNNRGIIATTEMMQQNRWGLGDEVIVVGLFRSHHGRQRNIPIIRVGNLAMMKGEPVRTDYCGYTEAHLVEARSIAGLSGSPVFLHVLIPFHQNNATQFRLLGLMHGHFDIKNLNEDTVVDAAADATGGINTGIGVVIPVEKILETIDQPELIELRKKLTEEMRKSGATADFAGEDGPPANGENPNANVA